MKRLWCWLGFHSWEKDRFAINVVECRCCGETWFL